MQQFPGVALIWCVVQLICIFNTYWEDGADLLVCYCFFYETISLLLLLGETAQSASSLEWHKRHAIAIGIAKGLRFLHEECHATLVQSSIWICNQAMHCWHMTCTYAWGLLVLQNGRLAMIPQRQWFWGNQDTVGAWVMLNMVVRCLMNTKDAAHIYCNGQSRCLRALHLWTSRWPHQRYIWYFWVVSSSQSCVYLCQDNSRATSFFLWERMVW